MISTPDKNALRLWYTQGGDIIIFVSMSLLLSIFIGQEKIITRADSLYWALILPALLLPLLRLRQTLKNLFFGVARPFLFLGVASSVWLTSQNDLAMIPPVLLLVWVSGWACREEARVSLTWLSLFLLLFYAAGIARFVTQPPLEEFEWLMSPWSSEPVAADGGFNPDAPPGEEDVGVVIPPEEKQKVNINGWGIFPGQTAPAYGPWRISVTPNIAASGIISVFAMLLAIGHRRSSRRMTLLLLVSSYFTVLSFVRSALIGLAIFSLSQLILKLTHGKPNLRVFIAFSIVFGLVVGVAAAPYLLYQFQDVHLISRLFLRGQTGLSVYDIYRQAYRPWLWSQHLQLFWQSEWLMGLGSDLAKTASENILNSGHVRSDSVSFPTRLLATYGLPAFALVYFLIERCYAHARNDDVWAISMLAVIFWLMMTWGSVFHPTNAVFVLAMLIAGKGKAGFSNNGRGGAKSALELV